MACFHFCMSVFWHQESHLWRLVGGGQEEEDLDLGRVEAFGLHLLGDLLSVLGRFCGGICPLGSCTV